MQLVFSTMQKRKHFTLPEQYQAEMERLAAEAHLPEGRWVAIHIMNAIDTGAPCTRIRKGVQP